MMSIHKSLLAVLLGAVGTAAIAAEPVKLYAAGSLTGALTAVIQQYQADTGVVVEPVFGPAGLLRERIEQGAAADVFISADMDSPQRLFSLGKAAAPLVLVRNGVCATVRADLKATPDNLLAKLLDPAVKIGTSTPKADPGGDYAWQLFAKADQVQPGARAILEAKAQQLVGGPSSPPVPAGKNAIKYYFETAKVDVFLGYCSSRLPSAKRLPDTATVQVGMPPSLAIVPDYGLTVVNRAGQQRPEASRFALYLMTPKAQRIMADYGFVPVGLPSQN